MTHDGSIALIASEYACVRVFDSNCNFVREFGFEWMQAKYGRFSGVCCGRGDQRDCIVVANYYDTCVHVATKFGDLIRTISCEHGYPTSVCVDLHNNIHVSTHSCKIEVFSWHGEPLRVFSIKRMWASDDGLDLCFDAIHNQLLVSDYRGNCIHVLSPDGDPIHVIGCRGSASEGLRSPHGICVGEQNTRPSGERSVSCLVVAETTLHRVSIYTWDGKQERLVTTIGKEGDGPTELRAPCGVCMDTTGRLVVTDHGNHRVHVIGPAATRAALLGCLLSEHLTTKSALPDCI